MSLNNLQPNLYSCLIKSLIRNFRGHIGGKWKPSLQGDLLTIAFRTFSPYLTEGVIMPLLTATLLIEYILFTLKIVKNCTDLLKRDEVGAARLGGRPLLPLQLTGTHTHGV